MIDRFYLLDTGFCHASEAAMVQGGARRIVDCHALVALFHHVREGWVLFDTGYAPRLTNATRHFPFRFYRWLLYAHTSQEQSAAGQLPRFGLLPGDIGHVVASHFHPDHAGGLWDFPQARFVCDRNGWEWARSAGGFKALHRGVLPYLLPPDFAARAQFTDAQSGPILPNIGPTYDMFGDGSCLLVPLAGHARGQTGLFLPETPRGATFLVADAVYQARAIRENTPFPLPTATFADDARDSTKTIQRLHEFWRERPDVVFLPAHCPEAFAYVTEWSKP